METIAPGKAKDPVCGMVIEKATAAATTEYNGITYYFCHPGCLKKFEAEPVKYIPEQVKDPVCGMVIDKATAAASAEYNGIKFHFCSPGCLKKFEAEPGKFVTISEQHHHHHTSDEDCEICHPAAVKSSGPSDVWYTCPMHPEVRQKGPGDCPKCGMALEPAEITEDAADDSEYRSMKRRFIISIILTLPVFLFNMTEMFMKIHAIPATISGWIQLALATPVVLWAGFPFFVRGVKSFRGMNLNMFTLIAIGTAAAYVYSLIAVLFPQWFPDSVKGHGGIGLYFEAAMVIITLVLLGQVLELRARGKTGNAIRALLNLKPENARKIMPDGSEKEISLNAVLAGDVLRVRPGEKVPVDGTITEGSGTLDESMISGEPVPVNRGIGETVIGATLNQNGSFLMRADKVGRDTLLSRIVASVSEAQRSRAEIQNLADKVSRFFVPAVILSSVSAFLLWFLIGPEPRFSLALINAVAVLIIACPCALGLATPMSVMVGIGRAAREGVLIRAASALEKMRLVDTLVLDKTGTITEGKPRIMQTEFFGGKNREEVMSAAAAAEKGSGHPLAAAFETAVAGRQLPAASDFVNFTGKGIAALVAGSRLTIGNEALMRDNKTDLAGRETIAAQWRSSGQTVLFIALNGELAGMIGIADPIRPMAAEAIKALKNRGIRTIMLTGDNEKTAAFVADKTGIDEVIAGVLPDQKGDTIRRLKQEGRTVAMAGDGINDAAALALADVGIAMGTGSAVAIESADMTLIRPDLNGLVRAHALSKDIIRNIRQNLLFAFGYNALGVPLAAGILYPFFGLLLSPMIAAAAMSFSSVSVIMNALRLQKKKSR